MKTLTIFFVLSMLLSNHSEFHKTDFVVNRPGVTRVKVAVVGGTYMEPASTVVIETDRVLTNTDFDYPVQLEFSNATTLTFAPNTAILDGNKAIFSFNSAHFNTISTMVNVYFENDLVGVYPVEYFGT